MDPDFSDLVDDVFDESMLIKFYAELKIEFRYHPSMDLEMIFRSIIKKTQNACCVLLGKFKAPNTSEPEIMEGQGQKVESFQAE